MATELNPNVYVVPTIKAIYQAMMCFDEMPHDQSTKQLLTLLGTSQLTPAFVCEWLAVDGLESGMPIIRELIDQKLIQGTRSIPASPSAATETALHACLEQLSVQASLLATDQGFHLANVGFSATATTDLAAVAAEWHGFHNKRAQQLRTHDLITTDVWSLLGQQAANRLTFWPLHTDHQNFILVIQGNPRIQHSGLVQLASILMHKYNH